MRCGVNISGWGTGSVIALITPFLARKTRSRSRFSLCLTLIGKPTAVQSASAMSSEGLKETKRDKCTLGHHSRDSETGLDPDAEFGGTEGRKKLEKRLLLKLDARISILVVIYILNFVSCTH